MSGKRVCQSCLRAAWTQLCCVRQLEPVCCHLCRYGSRSIDLLKRYYQNELTDLSMDDIPGASELDGKAESRAESNHHTSTSGRGPRNLPETPSTNGGSAGSAALHSETLAPRSALPPLLLTLGERPPEALQYLGTSFGLTLPLFNFWARSGYKPVYVRQTASDITGGACEMHAMSGALKLRFVLLACSALRLHKGHLSVPKVVELHRQYHSL